MINFIIALSQILAPILFLSIIWIMRNENHGLKVDIEMLEHVKNQWKYVAENEIEAKHEIGQMLADEQKKVKELKQQVNDISEMYNHAQEENNELKQQLKPKYVVLESENND